MLLTSIGLDFELAGEVMRVGHRLVPVFDSLQDQGVKPGHQDKLAHERVGPRERPGDLVMGHQIVKLSRL